MRMTGSRGSLRMLGALATLVAVGAAVLVVVVVVVAMLPGATVGVRLPASALPGLERVGGVGPGVLLDPTGLVSVQVGNPALEQQLLDLATVLPGLLLVIIIASDLARLLRSARSADPVSVETARMLLRIGRVAVLGGLAVTALDAGANWWLVRDLTGAGAFRANGSLPAWLAFGFGCAVAGRLMARAVAVRAGLDVVVPVEPVTR